MTHRADRLFRLPFPLPLPNLALRATRRRRQTGRRSGWDRGLSQGFLGVCLLAVLPLGPAGCNNDEEPPRELTQPPPPPNPLPRFLRGTVRYDAELTGYGRTLVQGYGVVVGLNGTGSNDTPIPIRAYIEKEYTRLTPEPVLGAEGPHLTMKDLLDSKDTAVVLVEGTIPPGALQGTRFDIRLAAVPGSSTTSLEGGRLWMTWLRRGLANPVGPQADPVAQARGDLFINPFAPEESDRRSLAEYMDDAESGAGAATGGDEGARPESAADPATQPSLADEGGGESESMVDSPDEPGRGGVGAMVNRRVARILNGGETTEDMPLMLRLRTPHHLRSRSITNAINARFPREAGQRFNTAEPVPGRADEQIAITVPPSWRDKTDVFVETLLHTHLSAENAEGRAAQLARWVQENPVDARDVTWCWVALGKRSVEGFSPLYDDSELIPRLAALNAGARLGDPAVIPHLEAIARDTTSGQRADVVERLGDLPGTPRVALILRDMLNDERLDVRIAAFEGLVKQKEPLVRRIVLEAEQEFELFAVPSQRPMVYATLQGKPRIVVFGDGLHVRRPALVTTLSDRFILACDGPDEPLRVRYRPVRTGAA